MERLRDSRHLCQARWEAAVDTRPSSSSRKCYMKKGIYMLNFSSPPAPIFFNRVPHCLAPHDSSPFTAECFILLQLSLVVWQKNWKSTDYVYFQNRAYQSVIRPLWCSLLYLRLMIRVISVLSPRMCCFPSRQGYLEYSVWAICVCGGVRMCVCDLFFKWYEWPFQTTTSSWDTRTQSLCLEQSDILTGLHTFLLLYRRVATVQVNIVTVIGW